jgi:hypothetical protein
MKIYLLKVENMIKISKSYISRQFQTQYQGSNGHSATSDAVKHELMRAKVVKVRKLDYIRTGGVVSGTHFFSVEKGTTDIRMVYNGTSYGLNDILYALHFSLPTVRENLWAILPDFFQCNLNVQDQFLNFKLHRNMQQYSGVDVSQVRSEAPSDAAWEDRGPDGGSGGKETGWG